MTSRAASFAPWLVFCYNVRQCVARGDPAPAVQQRICIVDRELGQPPQRRTGPIFLARGSVRWRS